jgi:hypothetical protein
VAINKEKLWEFLNNQSILLDEKRMWYDLGFYIYPHPTAVFGGVPKTVIVDVLLNEGHLSPVMTTNLRRTMMERWEEKKKKLAREEKEETKKEIPKQENQATDPLDELEARSK